jgi:opacity protein-like surface antigen
VRNSIVTALLVSVAMSAPASAQVRRPPVRLDDTPAISLRPFFVFAEERFAARQTFDAVFGGSSQPLWGGGLDVAFKKGFYVDVTASRFKKTGQRAFFSGGQAFGLGIPLTATLTPIDLTAGARFRITPRLFPYVGAGVGSYRYQETSQFDDGPFETRHVGYLVTGGLEFRVSRWVGVSGDAQYTRVSGIIGTGGVSQQTGDTDLGGIAGRFRVIVGR